MTRRPLTPGTINNRTAYDCYAGARQGGGVPLCRETPRCRKAEMTEEQQALRQKILDQLTQDCWKHPINEESNKLAAADVEIIARYTNAFDVTLELALSFDVEHIYLLVSSGDDPDVDVMIVPDEFDSAAEAVKRLSALRDELNRDNCHTRIEELAMPDSSVYLDRNWNVN